MLTFNLRKQWYEKIRSGEKTIEYREDKPYWRSRFEKEFPRLDLYVQGVRQSPSFFVFEPHECVLRLGYTKRKMRARITGIERLVSGIDTDLATHNPVFALHLDDVLEVEA